jgi:DNA repair photolyase
MTAQYRIEPCRSALNRVHGMPFEWSLNPYMGCAHRCTFCYVREFERRAERPSDDRYGRSIRVKTNVAQVLERELSRRSTPLPTVFIGAATDPYQPCEGRFRLTRACLEVCARHAQPIGIITRGPLIVRDIDVLREIARQTSVSINVSIPTLDDALWRATEPGTAPPEARLKAVRALADAGLSVAVALAPLIPGISDSVPSMTAVVRAAREAGANKLWTGMLYLKPGPKEHFLTTLSEVWPDEAARLARLYEGRAYLDRAQSDAPQQTLRVLRDVYPRRASAPDVMKPEPRIQTQDSEVPVAAMQLGLAFM